jgi:hypothetical protein
MLAFSVIKENICSIIYIHLISTLMVFISHLNKLWEINYKCLHRVMFQLKSVLDLIVSIEPHYFEFEMFIKCSCQMHIVSQKICTDFKCSKIKCISFFSSASRSQCWEFKNPYYILIKLEVINFCQIQNMLVWNNYVTISCLEWYLFYWTHIQLQSL